MRKSAVSLVAALSALGVVAVANGSSTPAGHAARTVVQLNLKRGGSATGRACGTRHHFATYRRGTRISYDGTVSPVPHGNRLVKVKIKRCVNGRWRATAAVHTRVSSTGRFKGSFRVRGRGSFFARAYYYVTTRSSVRSDKKHFRLR